VDKSALADTVVDVRKQLIENDRMWTSRRLESLQQQSAASSVESIQDKVKGELELHFYTLADTQARKEYGRK
jgi:hypothetical protein